MLSTVPLLAVGTALAILVGVWSPWSWVALVVAALLSVIYVAMMPSLRFRIHRWEVTDAAVYTKSGWLTQDWRIAPLSRIQTVDSSRGPIQQLLGLSTVTVTTASAAGAVAIVALDADHAAELVEYLTARTQTTPEDGT